MYSRGHKTQNTPVIQPTVKTKIDSPLKAL